MSKSDSHKPGNITILLSGSENNVNIKIIQRNLILLTTNL